MINLIKGKRAAGNQKGSRMWFTGCPLLEYLVWSAVSVYRAHVSRQYTRVRVCERIDDWNLPCGKLIEKFFIPWQLLPLARNSVALNMHRENAAATTAEPWELLTQTIPHTTEEPCGENTHTYQQALLQGVNQKPIHGYRPSISP